MKTEVKVLIAPKGFDVVRESFGGRFTIAKGVASKREANKIAARERNRVAGV